MCSNFRTLLFSAAIYLAIVEVIVGDAPMACITPFNSTIGHYFNAFESSQTTTKHAYGCANLDLPEISSESKAYQEFHIIDLKSDRAADIYLNINGIPHRTTDSLPQYEEYSYEFALFSEKDVIWLVSLWNMPNSSVSFKFYFPSGSQLISRNGHKYPSINTGVNRHHKSADNLLVECKDDFPAQEITSFSQIQSPRVAAINVTVGLRSGSQETWLSNSAQNCNKLKKYFDSPHVSIEKYEQSHQSLACEPKVAQRSPGLERCFIVDIKAANESIVRTQQIINLEVVRAKVSKNNSWADKKAIVVLRSTWFTLWKVHLAKDLRSTNIKFVSGPNEVLEGEGIVLENLDFNEDDYKVMARNIESRYNCNIISYVQYDSPADLVFLSLSEPNDEIGTAIFDSDTLSDKANVIYAQSGISCGSDGDLCVTIPSNALQEFGLSSANVELSIGSSTCDLEEENVDGLIEYKWYCEAVAGHDVTTVMFKVIFRTVGKHLLPSSVPEMKSVEIPVICRQEPERNLIAGNIRTMCDEESFFIYIPNGAKQWLDVSGISECESELLGYFSDTVYTFKRYSDGSCGATFRDGMFRITIPVEANSDGVLGEPVELSCTPVKVSTHYELQVFKDYNMRNPVPNGPILVPSGQTASDETTYHFKVSVDSNDLPLMVYLSQCSLKQDSRIVQILINQNNLVSSIVSFVKSQTKSNSQHFAVSLGDVIQKYERLQIECEVSACSRGKALDGLVEEPPMCINNLYEDGSLEDIGDIILASYHPDNLVSNIFKSVKENDENHNSLTTIDTPVMVILVSGAFVMGCIFIGCICCIDKWYKQKTLPGQRKIMKPNSDVGTESGSSRSTGSTKTNGSSFSSLFCLKSGKSSSSSSPTSSKDNLEMKPFLSPSTSDNQPHNTDVRLEEAAKTTTETEPSSSKMGSSYPVTLNSQPEGGGTANGKGFSTPSVSLPHLKLPLCQTSQDHASLPCKDVLPQGTSYPPHLHCSDQWTASPTLENDAVSDFYPVQVTQDEFFRLKEEAV